MAETSFLDPSTFHNFPEFNPSDFSFSDPNLFSGVDLPLPEGLASDLDLDDIDLDFSVDDLLLSQSEANDDGSLDPQSNSDSNPAAISNPGSPVSGNSSAASGVAADQQVKQEDENNIWRLKRKKEAAPDGGGGGVQKGNRSPSSDDAHPTDRSHKLRRAEEVTSSCTFSAGNDEDDKRKARLMRNRESAQLSRQRKKHYIEELEEKVKKLNSTIMDLNGKVSFYMSENARLHQQLTGNADSGNSPPAAAAAAYLHHPPPPPPPPYPFAWIPYGGYAMRPNGGPPPVSHVPIPRLKPQQPVSAAKAKKLSDSKKKNGNKTKKVASVSLLGLLLIMMVFGGLINFGFGFGRSNSGRVYGGLSRDSGRILNVKGRDKALNSTEEFSQFSGKIGRDNMANNSSRHQKEMYQNSSESLPALLYVPRNGKHVEINGNLIIHSVLASERTMMAQEKLKEEGKHKSKKEDVELAMTGNLASALAVPKGGRATGRHPKAYRMAAGQPRALASDSHDAYRDNVKSTASDGPLQQWFREGLAGPILSSGTCSEVFQFEISPPSSAIVPAASVVNVTEELPRGKNKNRRIMYPLPISLNDSTTVNNTKQFAGKPTESGDGNNTTKTSMVVSVMADPREAGDGDGDGMITPKALSRIFVVVLVDSVKYVTYSCMLPLKSHGPHLVN